MNEVGVNETEVNEDGVTEGVIGDNYPEANSPLVDNDDVSFHYDNALDVAFDDSNEDSGNDDLMKDGMKNLLGYYNDTEVWGFMLLVALLCCCLSTKPHQGGDIISGNGGCTCDGGGHGCV
ncbi:hypothetical protein KIW84_034294 [Lathyrus oleraceus]|uniref:Uncharacterized protein n=1 Tax=Pisum sativum TaxID=3888 RepID=A0A9D5B111_PEA|nr:hypothetical protein KIW84_034294 [Pisum sativum]